VDFGAAAEIGGKVGDADLLHLHNLHGYYLDYGALLELARDMPIVWTWHDMWGATGRCAFSHGCDGWKAGCQRCDHVEFYPSTWRDGAGPEYRLKTRLYTALRNLTIVTPSEWLREVAIARGFDKTRVVSVPNPVDVSTFSFIDRLVARARLGIASREKTLLFVAADATDKRKGYADFRYVVDRVGARGIVVGRPPKDDLSERIAYVGPVSSSRQLGDYYAAADALIVPSQADNFPNTVLESLSSGTIAFGYAVGGMPSQMPDWLDTLAREGSREQLCELVGAFLEVDAGREELRRQVRDYAVQMFSPSVVWDRYEKIYRAAVTMSGDQSHKRSPGVPNAMTCGLKVSGVGV
jgi:glycosyltransferase involved in cell wall biosynthesis